MSKIYGYHTFVHHHCISSHRSKKEYGDWGSNYDVSIEQRVVKTASHPDVNAGYDFQPGDIAYLVTAIWSSGDSFGNSRNGSSECIWLFKDPAVAMQVKRHFEGIDKAISDGRWNSYKPNQKPYVPNYFFENKEEQFVFQNQTYVPWSGYFESLTEIDVTMVLVEPDYDNI